MKQRLFLLLCSTIIALTAVLGLLSLPARLLAVPAATSLLVSSPPADKIEAALRAELGDSPSDQQIRFIIHLSETADLRPASLTAGRAARQVQVVERLQLTAAASQAPLLQQLDGLQAVDLVTAYHPFWIINAVAATGTVEAIQQIAALPEVSRIAPDVRYRYFAPPTHTLNLEMLLPAATIPDDLSWGVARIGGQYVWHGLGIDGRDVTVAIMDSGVDWLHPALHSNYRGNLGGSVQHAGNWFHAADSTILEPVDLLGHGTHVAGTAVGQDGLGVAPGAKWIAVAIADEDGFIYDSDVHKGFEWLMAPNGDPVLAPDIISNSWGGPGWRTNFQQDITALHAAGIITVFAAGNDGPFAGSLGSPASYPDILAVGASDDVDAVVWFSSRGPSPLTEEFKPQIVAPGTAIYSALPGNRYGYANGTSMATPHVAGAIALLLSANPTLSRSEVVQALTSTAVPISASHPNYDSGWGRLNAYEAVSRQVSTGILEGIVSHNGAPLASVAVTVTTPAGVQLRYQTDENGRYRASLQPGIYSLAVTSFGFVTSSASNIAVSAGQTTTGNVSLSRVPSGVVEGVVRVDGANTPLLATIHVVDKPVTATTSMDGRYSLTLPQGQYQLLVQTTGHRVGRATIQVNTGQTVVQNFSLLPAPSIMLVDSGQWYYRSYATYYKNSLTDLNYSYDEWTVRDPFNDIPVSDDLASYDIVIWSAPFDAPGYIGANAVITDYLATGGNLLISGQDVGNYDGYGFTTQLWWYRDLEAIFLGEAAVTQTLTGAAGTPFSGLAVTLNGNDSARNQVGPDQVRARRSSLTQSVFHYEDGQAAALQAGDCNPFRIIYLGFGLEGVTSAADRTAILNRSLNYFLAPATEVGLKWEPSTVDDFAVPGSQFVYTLTLRNLSETMTDTFRLSLTGNNWQASLVTPTLTLGPCETGETVLTIDVPGSAPMDFIHTMQAAAVSGNRESVTAQLNLRHKTPGSILLVDDDRWYNREGQYQTALDAMGLSYDYWDIGWDEIIRGSPPQQLINAYDIVVWYTGYDWFAPVTAAENEVLTNYLAGGGRLFLSSQDFLYYHQQTALARRYLGVLDYIESVTPTHIYGGPVLLPTLAGPIPLDYDPYQNFSDGLIPAPGSQPFLWHDQGMAAGIATAQHWRAVFWGIPFETLPPAAQLDAMNGVMGWLGDLGDSTFTIDQRTGPMGEPRAFTITLRNNGPLNQVVMTNTLPAALELNPQTVTGDAAYNLVTRQLTWQGQLKAGEVRHIRYQAAPVPGLTDGTRIDNNLAIGYQRHNLQFNQATSMWTNAPDLGQSALAATAGPRQKEYSVTYTLRLHNSGLAATNGMTAVVRLADDLTPLTHTLSASDGLAELADQRIGWQGDLAPGGSITVTLVLTHAVPSRPLWLAATAVIADGVTDSLLRENQLYLAPYLLIFPIVFKN